ncbi:COPII coat assembly protein sec16 [Elsinoe australis]|uniref:Protein transport protein sec16 n=1 Tax=Elsinoe australis TaxID=40998 RepID=A0A4U7ASQ4_9PEZI|nr:COPII coat assembly protein sec16 [Elsinoe australis]
MAHRFVQPQYAAEMAGQEVHSSSAFPEGSASWNPAFRPHFDASTQQTQVPAEVDLTGEGSSGEPINQHEDTIVTQDDGDVTEIESTTSNAAPDDSVSPEAATETVFANPAASLSVNDMTVGEEEVEPFPTSEPVAAPLVNEEHDENQVTPAPTQNLDFAPEQEQEEEQEAQLAIPGIDEPEEVAEVVKDRYQENGTHGILENQVSQDMPSEHAAPVEEVEPEGAQYEHQGHVTEADLAVDEAPTASLLNEPEMLLEPEPFDPLLTEQQSQNPFDEQIHNSSGVPADMASSHEPIELKGGKRDTLEGGDEFDDILGKQQQSHPDDFFASTTQDTDASTELRDQNEQVEDAFAAALQGSGGTSDPTEDAFASALQGSGAASDQANASAPAPATETKGEDLEDLWAAAFDDDDLLDTSAVDPSGFFDNDDGGFLDDGDFLADSTVPDAAPIQQISSNASTSKDAYAPPLPAQRQQNQYAPASNSSYNQYHQSFGPRSGSTPATFLPGMAGQYADMPSGPRRPEAKSSGSFVDKAKAGYSSPYDLPTEIIAPRKRAPALVSTPVQPAPPPPPRTSSMTGLNVPQTGPPRPPSNASAIMSPTTPSMPPTQQSPRKASNDTSGFFADLPMAPKLKPRQTTYTPVPASGIAPTPGPPQPQRALTQPPVPAPSAPPSQAYGGLRQPERLPLYPEQSMAPPAQTPQAQAPPVATSRYSPAPVNQQVPQASRFSPMPPAPPAQSRYAATPTPPVSAAQRAQAFIPKTSSPLAYHDGAEQTKQRQASLTSPQMEQDQARLLGHRSRLSGQMDDATTVRSQPERTMTPPQGPPKAMSVQNSPRAASRYAPSTDAPARPMSPPKRSRTQSPLQAKRSASSYAPVADRKTSTMYSSQPMQPTQPQSQLALPSRNQFSSDLNFDVPQDERAADHLERWKGHPIFRWAPSGILVSSFPKQMPFYAAGHAIPVIKCSMGSITIHDTKDAFPLDDKDNRFPGPLQGKGKGKKKDVLTWMTAKIEAMEKDLGETLLDLSTPTIIKQRAEEKVLLWKAVRLFIEHDNVIEGKSGVDEALRRLLVPNDIDLQSPLNQQTDADRQGSATEQQDPNALAEVRKLLFEGQREKAVWFATEKRLWSHAMLIASTMGPELWKQLIHEFVKSQVKGPGDGLRSLAAVYEVFGGNHEESIDELVPPFARAGLSLGGGAGASAANLDGLEKWRETLSLILSNRSASDGQAIAALGRLLAGYGRVEAAHTCYLFARTFVNHNGPDDPEAAFVLLGADHKAPSPALGSDLDTIMLTEVYEYAQSLHPTPGFSPIIPHLQAYKLIHAYGLAEHGLRSEAQSYCESIYQAIKSTTKASPYYHPAFTTAVDDLNRCLSQAPQTSGSSGLFSKLSSDKVSGSMWKRFNTFVAGDDDDKASTGSGPGEDAAGPFGKVTGNSPAISRAASSVDLYGAMASGAGMNGSAMYSSQMSPNGIYTSPQQVTAQPTLDRTVSGRYAPQPAGTLAAQPQTQRSISSTRPYEPQRTASAYAPSNAGSRAPSKGYSPYAPQSQESRQPSYAPYTPAAAKPEAPVRSSSDYNIPYAAGQAIPPPIRPPSAGLHPPALGSPYKPQPSPLSAESSPPSQNGYIPSITHSPEPATEPQEEQNGGYNPPAASYEPSSSSIPPPTASYEPPSASFPDPEDNQAEEPSSSYDPPSASYEPPTSSYQPYEPDFNNEPEEDDDAPKPKKKGIMDLSDDEDFPRAPPPSGPSASTDDAASKAAQRAAADRAADEAFRKAAEADAERDKAGKDGGGGAAGKKGWFGGWFGGKKEEDLQPKAVRAKLGEENSFYFDKDLGKWVNKKGGAEETKAAPTPPPPMRAGPPSRVASGAPTLSVGPGGPGAPPSGPPSRVASGVGLAGMGAKPPTAAGTPPPPGAAPPVGLPGRVGTPGGLEPPSRPGTGLSNASSIDDLIGAPGAKKGTVKGKKRGGRYVDVMAK